MTTRMHIGAKDLRGDIAAYAKRFDFLEVRGPAASDTSEVPSAATLRRWRRAVPPQFEFAVICGPNVAKLNAGEAMEVELAAMTKLATTLESRVFLVPTVPDVTPGRRWRDRLEALVARLVSDVGSVVWEPSGLWEAEDAASFGRKIGAVVAVDPARDAVPDGPVAYCRLRALGATRAFSAAALANVAEAIGVRREAYVVVETAAALKEAKTLRALVRGGSVRKRLPKLVRPRGGPLDVGDDEQE